MPSSAGFNPQKLKVNRSRLRQNQSQIFRQARGAKIVEITAWHEDDEKYLVDKKYFDDLVKKLRATVETLEVMADLRLFQQILRASETLGRDLRRGKLHSFEEAFGDK